MSDLLDQDYDLEIPIDEIDQCPHCGTDLEAGYCINCDIWIYREWTY